MYELARSSINESFRQGAIDLATRLETSENVRQELLEEFRKDAHGLLLNRALNDLEEHLRSPTLAPDSLLATPMTVLELLQGGTDWKFWRVFGIDLGGRTGEVGISMQFRRGKEDAKVRIVCKNVTRMLIKGHLILVDGGLKVDDESEQCRIEIHQGDFQFEVHCAAFRMINPWKLTAAKEFRTKGSHD